MVLINQKWYKILELFFEYPDEKFTVRDISKRTKIPSSSVQRYITQLRKLNIIDEENKTQKTPYVKFLKTFFMIDKMHKTGLIEYLEKKLISEVIILFGSVRKGEYDKESDIDLFIATTTKTDIHLKEFREKLGHEIQLFIEKDINKLQPHLFNNVLNGIKLSGYVKVR